MNTGDDPQRPPGGAFPTQDKSNLRPYPNASPNTSSTTTTKHRIQSDIIVGRLFSIGKKIGSGAFGDIYHGQCNWFAFSCIFFCGTDSCFLSVLCLPSCNSGMNIKTKEECAIKLESVRIRPSQLLNEYKMYLILKGGRECLFLSAFSFCYPVSPSRHLLLINPLLFIYPRITICLRACAPVFVAIFHLSARFSVSD